MNRQNETLDRALGAMVLGLFGWACGALISATFLAGFAIGKHAVMPLLALVGLA